MVLTSVIRGWLKTNNRCSLHFFSKVCRAVKSQHDFPICINLLYEEYRSFFLAKRWKRIQAIKWAQQHIKDVAAHTSPFEFSENDLLQRVGWRTFIGLGFHSGVASAVYSYQAKAPENNMILPYVVIANKVTATISAVLSLTNIAYLRTLDSNLKTVDDIFCARVDELGNVLIYPADVEQLVSQLASESEA